MHVLNFYSNQYWWIKLVENIQSKNKIKVSPNMGEKSIKKDKENVGTAPTIRKTLEILV